MHINTAESKTIQHALRLLQCLRTQQSAQIAGFPPEIDETLTDQALDTLLDRFGSPDNSMEILLDTPIRDWRYSQGEDDNDISPDDRANYRLLIERDRRSDQIWINVTEREGASCHQYAIGLNAMLEIRGGLPAMSVGITPDQNVIHLISNGYDTLAVIPESNQPDVNYQTVDFTPQKHQGYCFIEGADPDGLQDARFSVAQQLFSKCFSAPDSIKEDTQVIVNNRYTAQINYQGALESFIVDFKSHSTHPLTHTPSR
jgi:hypothetical protein